MKHKRLIAAALLGGALIGAARSEAGPRTLKLSHQWPGGTIDAGDLRDRLARKFAKAVKEGTGGQLRVEVHPKSELYPPKEQFDALRDGQLDLTVYPISYAGPEVPEFNIFAQPAIIQNYAQALRWKDAPIGQELERVAESKGVKFLGWFWLATAIASVPRPIVAPDDVKGLHIRTGSRPGNLVFKAAGGLIASLPSTEIYDAMDQGVLDAFSTTSESLVSFKIYKLAKYMTSARKHKFSVSLQALLVSKKTFDSLTAEQQKVLIDAAASLETYAAEQAQKDDEKAAEMFARHGVEVADIDDAAFQKWRELSRATALKDFEENTPNGKKLVEMALEVQ